MADIWQNALLQLGVTGIFIAYLIWQNLQATKNNKKLIDTLAKSQRPIKIMARKMGELSQNMLDTNQALVRLEEKQNRHNPFIKMDDKIGEKR